MLERLGWEPKKTVSSYNEPQIVENIYVKKREIITLEQQSTLPSTLRS